MSNNNILTLYSFLVKNKLRYFLVLSFYDARHQHQFPEMRHRTGNCPQKNRRIWMAVLNYWQSNFHSPLSQCLEYYINCLVFPSRLIQARSSYDNWTIQTLLQHPPCFATPISNHVELKRVCFRATNQKSLSDQGMLWENAKNLKNNSNKKQLSAF